MEASRHKQVQTLTAYKFSFPASKQHLFLTAHRKHYLFFVGEETAFLVTPKEGKLEMLKEIKMKGVEPIHMVSTGNGDIHILHSGGILWQYLEYLAKDAPFKCIDIPEEVSPVKLLITAKGHYIVVLADGDFLLLENGQVTKRCHVPSKMLMEKMVVDCTRR